MPESQKKKSQSYMGGGNEASSASSSYDSGMRRRRLYCYCRMVSPLVTSWTDENPGRRFYGCGLYQVEGRKGCNFFDWYDNEMTEHEKKIIRALLRKVDELKNRETELKNRESELKTREKLLGVFLVLSWVIVMVMVFAFVRRDFLK